MNALGCARLLILLVLLTKAPPGRAERATAHRVSIDVRGPLALVQVDRPLVFGAEYGRADSDEVVVDLDLPDGAVLASAELRGEGRTLRLQPAAAAETGRRYGEALRAASWRAAKVPLDEGVDLRLQASTPGLGEGARASSWALRYRFGVQLACRQGRLVLAMPGSLDPAPTDAALDVRLQLGRVAFSGPTAASVQVAGSPLRTSGASVARARTTVSVRRAWELVVELPPARGPDAALGYAFAAGAAVGAGQGLLAASVCRPLAERPPPPASRLLLLVDRSRSVGPGGAALERDLARALVLALPPSLTFNVVFFDRAPEPLFPLPRSATLEALGALENAVGLGSLRNGTDLPAALRRAVELTTSDAGEARAPTYWVVMTDGALLDEHTPAVLAAAVARTRPEQVEVAMLVLRQDGDEPSAPGARRALAEVPARLGGSLRELAGSAAVGSVPAIVEGLRGSGDLIHPAAQGAGAAGVDRPLALTPVSIPPGSGGQMLARIPAWSGGPLRLRARHAGASVALRASVVDLGGSWARALLPRPAPAGWTRIEPFAAALISPTEALPGAQEPPVRGRMERDVVQRALGYAFLPRARACYLTRAIKSAADFQLKGRLRLELHLERGEMMGAAVRRSTLGRPDIEECLREAAFAVEVPRALHSDAPVIAALNLVFRPRTEARIAARGPDAGAADEAIDRLLGPRPPPSDPLELLIEDTQLDPASQSPSPGAAP